jgi:hypothetical protein
MQGLASRRAGRRTAQCGASPHEDAAASACHAALHHAPPASRAAPYLAPSPTSQAPLAGAAPRGGGVTKPGRGGGLITVRNPAAVRTRGAAAGGPPPPRGGGGGRVPLQKPPPGKWGHDLYNPHQGGGAAAAAPIIGGGGPSRGSNVIKNKL